MIEISRCNVVVVVVVADDDDDDALPPSSPPPAVCLLSVLWFWLASADDEFGLSSFSCCGATPTNPHVRTFMYIYVDLCCVSWRSDQPLDVRTPFVVVLVKISRRCRSCQPVPRFQEKASKFFFFAFCLPNA